MDLGAHDRARALVGRAYQGILALSGHAQSRWSKLTLLSGAVGRRALTGSLFVGALCVAVLAHDSTARESLRSWKLANLPQLAVWRHALGARGYRELRESEREAFQRALKSLPSQTDIAGQVWTGTDSAWVSIFHGGGETPVQIFCRRCKGKPEAWAPVEGIGWDALAPALEEAERLARAEKPAVARAEPRDPRAIYY